MSLTIFYNEPESDRPIAWRLSGFQIAALIGRNPRFTDEAIAKNLQFVEVIERIAARKGATKAQIALAWVLRVNGEITAIPGTKKIHRLEENLGALGVDLTVADLEEIEAAVPGETVGGRY